MRKFFIVAVLLAVPAWWFVSQHSAALTESNAETTSQTPTAASAQPAAADTSSLDNAISQIIAKNPDLNISVSITDLQTDQSYHYGDSSAFIAASTSKLITATYLLQEVEAGGLDLDDYVGNTTAQTQLRQLIELSDNAAWNSLNNYLGTAALQQYARQIGLSSYDSGTNTITSDNMALLLSKLYQGKLLNQEHTDLLLSHMRNADSDQYIPAAVPASLSVYHKSGYLADRLHDTAIIEDTDHAFVLVIFTKASNPYDFATGTSIMHQITRASVQTFLDS